MNLITKPLLAMLVLVMSVSERVKAQDDQKTMDIYGFVMMDAGYNFNQIHPDWFDVVRPTKLPAFKNEFGKTPTQFLKDLNK